MRTICMLTLLALTCVGCEDPEEYSDAGGPSTAPVADASLGGDPSMTPSSAPSSAPSSGDAAMLPGSGDPTMPASAGDAGTAEVPLIPLILWVDDLVDHHTNESSAPDTVEDKRIMATEELAPFAKYFE